MSIHDLPTCWWCNEYETRRHECPEAARFDAPEARAHPLVAADLAHLEDRARAFRADDGTWPEAQRVILDARADAYERAANALRELASG